MPQCIRYAWVGYFTAGEHAWWPALPVPGRRDAEPGRPCRIIFRHATWPGGCSAYRSLFVGCKTSKMRPGSPDRAEGPATRPQSQTFPFGRVQLVGRMGSVRGKSQCTGDGTAPPRVRASQVPSASVQGGACSWSRPGRRHAVLARAPKRGAGGGGTLGRSRVGVFSRRFSASCS